MLFRKVFVAILFVVLLVVGCGDKKLYKIEYKVTGTVKKKVSVTYLNEKGGREEITDVSLPWSKTLEAKADTLLYLSAMANLEEKGKLTVAIYQGNEELSSATSEGKGIIAETSAFVKSK
jgi:hypothetical protein